jgi:predicted transcriptional regulator
MTKLPGQTPVKEDLTGIAATDMVTFSMSEMRINGRHLRALRELRKWSLTDLSRVAGVTVSTLSRAERGERDLAEATIERIAETFGVPLVVLVNADRDESVSA